jgi:hypothetical protein
MEVNQTQTMRLKFSESLSSSRNLAGDPMSHIGRELKSSRHVSKLRQVVVTQSSSTLKHQLMLTFQMKRLIMIIKVYHLILICWHMVKTYSMLVNNASNIAIISRKCTDMKYSK